jgi:uncharacterized cofD-like protein
MAKKVVIIGGGNGTSTLIKGLRGKADLTAIVSMADDGGSTGQLRRELGASPAGDVRQCLVALSDSPDLQKLFSYRFDAGSLDGHSFGNLFLAAAERTTGGFEQAIQLAEKILDAKGNVLPVTTDNVHLVLEDGQEISGVYQIANTTLTQPKLRLEPSGTILPTAHKAIMEADLVVIAPGNLYGSIAPALLVGGVGEALKQTSAKVVYVCNLVNRNNHTQGFKVSDYADEIERFVGAEVLDYMMYNNRPIESGVRDTESEVTFDEQELKKVHYKAIGLALVDKTPAVVDPNDKIPHIRSLVRHDAEAVAKTLMEL